MTGQEEVNKRQKGGRKKTNKGVQKDRQMGTRTGICMQEIQARGSKKTGKGVPKKDGQGGIKEQSCGTGSA
jgi:hypothetical protein